MKTTVTIVRTYDDETDECWVDITCDEDRDADLIEALGIMGLGKALLIEAGGQ